MMIWNKPLAFGIILTAYGLLINMSACCASQHTRLFQWNVSSENLRSLLRAYCHHLECNIRVFSELVLS